MSRLLKGSLIAAVSILFVGIAIYTVGMIGGGREEVRKMEDNGDLNFLKNHLRVRALNGLNFSWWPGDSVHFWDNDIDFLDDESIISHDTHNTHDTHHDSDFSQSAESIDVSSVTELDIELGGGYLYIDQGASNDNIQIAVEARDDADIKYYVKNGTLHIEGFKSKNWNMISNPDKNVIYVTIPKDFTFQKSEIELGAGYIEMNGGGYGKTDIVVGAGEIVCNGIKTGKMETEVGAGAVEVTDIEADEIDFSVAMGSATISGGMIGGNIELDCEMGSLYLDLNGSEEDYNYEIECSMGNILIGTAEYSGLGKEKYINNHAAKELKAECDMGSIEVVFSK